MFVDIKDFMLKSTMEKIAVTSGGKFNDKHWQVAGIPLGDGTYFMYEDKAAQMTIVGDNIVIDIPKFTHFHDQVQIFDNPKQLYLSKSGFAPGAEGIVAFSCNMKARITGGAPQDFRDGFCAFNVLDFSTGMVFDIVSNGSQVWAIYERLLIPNVINEDKAFTKVISVDYSVNFDNSLDCMIIYNRIDNRTSYYLGDRLIYEALNIPVKIDSLFMAFGLITLHPLVDGKSVSCKGQGGTGIWGDFEVRRL